MRTALFLPRLQAQAESRMGADNGGCTGDLLRRDGTSTQNESSGLVSHGWITLYTGLPARFTDKGKRTDSFGKLQIAEVQEEQPFRVISLPVATTNMINFDLFRVTAGSQKGSVWRILDASSKDQATALRVPAVWVPAPVEWGDWDD